MAPTRQLHIQFLTVQPHHREALWPPAAFPWEAMIDEVDEREPKRRQIIVGVGHRATAAVHRQGAHHLLSVHNIAVAARATAADDGAINVIEYDDRGGPTAASHLLHLEDDVFGLAREVGGPGYESVATYLAILLGGPYTARFLPIGRPDGVKRLDRMAKATSVTVGMAVSPIKGRVVSNPFIEALQAAASHIDADEITMTARIKRSPQAQRHWFEKNKPALTDFLEGDRAAITAAQAGAERLLETAVTATSYVSSTDVSVRPEDAIMHIRGRYDQQRDEIQESLGRKP